MKLTAKEIQDILQFEIKWHLDNPDKELNHDQQMGFLNGLRHAQTVIRLCEEHRVEFYAPRLFTTCQHGYVVGCPICPPPSTAIR